jgi:hypothetical protein
MPGLGAARSELRNSCWVGGAKKKAPVFFFASGSLPEVKGPFQAEAVVSHKVH